MQVQRKWHWVSEVFAKVEKSLTKPDARNDADKWMFYDKMKELHERSYEVLPWKLVG